MKIVASMVVRNETHRYLQPCIDHLLEFCDLITILDDGSEDNPDYGHNKIKSLRAEHGFYKHEGRQRNALLNFTLGHQPTHVLAIDADEFVADGPQLRKHIELRPDIWAWTLCMEEIWAADQDNVHMREDGQWCAHEIPIVWKNPQLTGPQWEIADRALACGRVPQQIHRVQTACPAIPIMHFGWTNVTERQKRYDRYLEHDNGQYHNNRHLNSIMNQPQQTTLKPHKWPEPLQQYKPRILASCNTPR